MEPRRHVHILVPACALVVALGGALLDPSFSRGPGPTTAAGPPVSRAWGPVADLTPLVPAVFSPTVAVDRDGNAAAVWAGNTYARPRLHVADRSPTGIWGPSAVVPGTRGAAEVAAAFDRSGELVLVWTSGRRVLSARRAPAGGWTTPTLLHRTPGGSAGTIPASLVLAVNDRGRAVVAWETLDDDQDAILSRPRVQAVVGTPSGAWGSVRSLARNAIRPQVSLDRSGRAVLVWEQLVGDRDTGVAARTRAPGHGWSSARTLTRPGAHAGLPRLAGRATGDVVVCWTFENASGPGLRVRRWSPTLGWQPASRMPGFRGHPWWVALGMDASGRATLGWGRYEGGIHVVDQDLTGRWGTAERLHDVRPVFLGLALEVNAAGDAVLGWQSLAGDQHPVQAAYRPASGTWGSAVDLSSTVGTSFGPALAVEPDGDAVAVWSRERSATADRQRIQARSLLPE